jgi:hypothetical protein
MPPMVSLPAKLKAAEAAGSERMIGATEKGNSVLPSKQALSDQVHCCRLIAEENQLVGVSAKFVRSMV